MTGQPAKASPIVNERSFTYSTKTSYQDKVLTLAGKETKTVIEREDGDEVGESGRLEPRPMFALT